MAVAAIWILWLELCRWHDMLSFFSHLAQYDTAFMMLMRSPLADHHPDIEGDILNATLTVAWDYSINGNESHRAGHILVVGRPEQLMRVGHCKGRGEAMWQGGEPCKIQTQEGASELRKFMNLDGAHIIDSTTGQIWAGQFFADGIGGLRYGGAGASAAQALSTVMGTVTFKISNDGSITEFRAGKPSKKHCGNRIAPTPSGAPRNFLRNGLGISAAEPSAFSVRYQQWRATGELSPLVTSCANA